jgi:hypothetical protein
MDPTQAAAALQNSNPGGMQGAAPVPTPQQLLTIQNLMKNPGGLGAMQPQPMQPMTPPPQAQPQNMSQGGMMQPMQNQQQLLQLMGTPSGQ